MTKRIIALCGLSGVLVLGLSACEKSTPAPPSATGTSGGGLNNLAENPNSLLGKSAAAGRDAARKASSAQDATVGAAQEITGEAAGLNVAGLSWSVPASWQKSTPSSSMRAAEFKVMAADGGGESVVAVFAGIGGDSQSNIERWRTQFAEPGGGGEAPKADIQTKTIAGCKVFAVSLRGTYKGGTMGGPTEDMPDAALRGAVIEGGPQGPVFIKWTGPEATILEHEAAWNTMINGMRKQ